MKNRVIWASLVCGSMLLGCSTALPPSPASATSPTPPPVALQMEKPNLLPAPDLPPSLPSAPLLVQPCKLGTSCLDLDPRPFEICLVGTGKRCLDKATEPLLVLDPQPAHPDAAPIQVRSE